MKSLADSNVPLFSNDFVKCYSDYLVINLYYFPFGKKKIKYENIRSCEFHSMDTIDIFDYKLWGMALSPIWWHCDIKRFSRKSFLLLDANQWPKIGLTMDDNDIGHVCDLIRGKIFSKPTNSLAISEKSLEHQKSLQQNQFR